MQLIQLSQLNKFVGNPESPAHILKKINLTIEQGDFVAIIGASGSGKSTLMNILGCLDTASSGSYRIAGKETQQLNADELSNLRQQQFGFIFQRYNLLPTLTALENVALPAIYAGVEPSKRLERAKQLLVNEEIFRPFYRVAEDRARQTGGTGLGLAIVFNAIQQHKGSVTAGKSHLGGLSIKIQLPLWFE